jgi:hypothetical protein
MPLSPSACDTLKGLHITKLQLLSNIRQTAKDCEAEKYNEFVSKYFSKTHNTVKDLLKCIYTTYRHGRATNNAFELPLKAFIDMFPRDSAVADTNFKRQHVFEHICRLLLQYNDDDGELGRFKQFYGSLETFHPKTSQELTNDEMVKERLNTGSSAQSVDIFYKVTPGERKESDTPKQWACDKPLKTIDEGGDTFVLIQCKYYEHEKSEPSKYDLPKMYSRARQLEASIGNRYKIVLMVNDKQALEDKFRRQRFGDHQQIDKDNGIFGVKEIDRWFQNMLHRAIQAGSFDEFIQIKAHGNKPTLQLRFHQRYFIDSTLTNLATSKKFIWGAVPRSGKTYMIGGMVSRRQNDTIIILGAKSETEGQFLKLFTSHSDFDAYRIVVGSTILRASKSAKATLFLWSQEYLKNKINNKTHQFTEAFQKSRVAEHLIKTKQDIHVDLYFDEIHKGGSTEKARAIIDALIHANVSINFFTMVTATFAKPTLAYEHLRFDKKKSIDKKKPLIIEWSYIDNQYMKTISQVHTKDLLLSSRPSNLQGSLDAMFKHYENIYGSSYLTVLEEDYKNNPELVILQPDTILSKLDNFNDTLKNAFSLRCTAFDYESTVSINNPHKLFAQYDQMRDFLSVIAGNDDVTATNYQLLQSSLYGFFKYKLKYDILKPHTELWFIPAIDLYGTQNCDEVAERNKHHLKKLKVTDMPEDNAPQAKTSRPHIEPMSRAVALALMKHPFFKEKCCVLIVHEDYALFQVAKGEHLKEECIFAYNSTRDKDIVDFIKQKEHDTYMNNKTLIILAAHKLRLGVSLPCVDVVMNFDSVQSVDSNYQTMFRCLTERHDKRYGYYVDFNKERAIDFLYTYNTTYGSGTSKTVDEDVMELQQLMLQFNYNGITFVKEDKMVKHYNDLIEKLHLTRHDYVQRTADLNAMQKTIRNVLTAHGDFSEFNTLYKLVQNAFSLTYDEAPQKLRATVKEGVRGKRYTIHDSAQSLDQESNTDDQDDMETNMTKTISELLIILPPLLAIFSIETELHCTTLDDCFQSAIDQIETFSAIGNALCSCETIDTLSAVGCYLSSVSKTKKVFHPKKLKRILDEVWLLLDKNKRLYNLLKIQFESVREETMKGNRLVEYLHNTM